MKTERWIMSFSKGNHMGFFWRLFSLRQKAAHRFSRYMLTFFLNRMAHRRGGYIGSGAQFKGTPILPHGLHGVFVSRYAKIGTDCRIYQNVTIGEVDGHAPEIGDHCLIGAGAVIIGDIKIGNHVKIGAGVTVSRDIPDGATVVSQPPRILPGRCRDD